MYVTRYNPARDFQEFRKGFESMHSLLDSFIQNRPVVNLMDFEPAVNSREAEDAYHIELDLPGMKKGDITIDVKDNTLTISGERKIRGEVEEGDYYKIESSYGKFSRSFALPDDVDVDKIEAKSEDGVLEVVIPKVKKVEKKPRKIKIK